MEVEVKLRLPNTHAHQNLLSLLSPFHTRTLLQENLFFDGRRSELASTSTALRLRFYNQDNHSRCVLALKSKPTMSAGISRIEEVENDLDPFLGRACVAEPWRLAQLPRPNSVIDRLCELGLGHVELLCIGGFRNVRNVYDWKGLRVEVDETMYEFGTCYEVECETERPLEAKSLLEELLKGRVTHNSRTQKSPNFLTLTHSSQWPLLLSSSFLFKLRLHRRPATSTTRKFALHHQFYLPRRLPPRTPPPSDLKKLP